MAKKTSKLTKGEGTPRPQFDQNGRPNPPELRGLTDPRSATDDQKLMVLRWAADWCSYTGTVSETWLYGLNNTLVGIREKGVRTDEFLEEKRVLGMAARALYLEAGRNRSARAAAAFPWRQVRLGPCDLDDADERPCAAAQELEGKLIPHADTPFLPLPGCDARVCRCWITSVARAETKTIQNQF